MQSPGGLRSITPGNSRYQSRFEPSPTQLWQTQDDYYSNNQFTPRDIQAYGDGVLPGNVPSVVSYPPPSYSQHAGLDHQWARQFDQEDAKWEEAKNSWRHPRDHRGLATPTALIAPGGGVKPGEVRTYTRQHSFPSPASSYRDGSMASWRSDRADQMSWSGGSSVVDDGDGVTRFRV